MSVREQNRLQTNKWTGRNFSRGTTVDGRAHTRVRLVDRTETAWNRSENNFIPAGTTAIQSSLIQNFGVRLLSTSKRGDTHQNGVKYRERSRLIDLSNHSEIFNLNDFIKRCGLSRRYLISLLDDLYVTTDAEFELQIAIIRYGSGEWSGNRTDVLIAICRRFSFPKSPTTLQLSLLAYNNTEYWTFHFVTGSKGLSRRISKPLYRGTQFK